MTDQQSLFCKEYLKDLNAAAAAERAGYAKKTANKEGYRLMQNEAIRACIQTLMDKRAKKIEVSAEYVLSKIKDTIERCSQAEQVMEWSHDEKTLVPTGEWKFEHQGVLKGCELLGRHLKLFTDKIEHSGKVTLEELVLGSKKNMP